MNIRIFGVAILVAAAFIGCSKTGKTQADSAEQAEEIPTVPYAKLQVYDPIDLGVFEGEHLQREVTMQLANVGNDTLRITAALPDCNCMEILRVDSTILPGGKGALVLSLDLSGYPKDTIYQELGIMSNSYKERARKITVFGIRK
jgi:hypothetical protein